MQNGEVIKWDDVKELYNNEDEIDQMGFPYGMRGLIKVGFPLKLVERTTGRMTRFKNILDRKKD